MRLPEGHVIALQVRDISETGVGLTSSEPLPVGVIVDFEMDVPPLAGGMLAPVGSAIKTCYAVVRGAEILCGATWQRVDPAGLELLNGWIRRLRG